MIHAINHCQNTSFWESTKMEPPFLPFDAPNLCNDYIFMNLEYGNPLCFLNHVDLNTDLLNNVFLKKVIVQPTEKTKECRPTQIKPEYNKE